MTLPPSSLPLAPWVRSQLRPRPRRAQRRPTGALLLWLVLLTGVAAAATPPLTPYDRETKALAERVLAEAAARSPGAVAPLLQLQGRYDLVTDRDALLAQTAALVTATRPLPLVQAQALWLRREVLRHHGDEAEAAALTRELGLVPPEAVALLGPFDNDGQRGHEPRLPPEDEARAPGPDQSYTGKSRAVPLRWRTLPAGAATRDGSLPLGALLRPEEFITAFAVTYVRNDQKAPLPVAVRVGASGPLRVYVNRGKAVLDRDLYRTARLDQEAAAAVLRPGWNRVLIKVSGAETPPSLLLRLTAPDGAPLRGLSFAPAPPEPGWSVPAALPSGPTAPTLLAALRQRLSRASGREARAQALRDLGLFLNHFIPGDPAEREDEALLREALGIAGGPRASRLLAEVTEDADRRREVLREALAAKPADDDKDKEDRALLLLQAGALAEEAHRDREAEARYREALALAPTLYTAAQSLASLQSSRGLPSEAAAVLGALPPPLRLPTDLGDRPALPVRLLRAHASLASRRDQQALADALYEAVLRVRPDDGDALRHRLDRRRARGEVPEALQILDLLQRGRPEQAFLHRERVETLEGAGQIPAALAAADAALGLIPGDAELWQLKGRLLQRSGKIEAAVAALRQSLALRPQNPELRAYLSRVDPQAQSGEDLWRRFRVDAAALQRPAVDPRSKDPARVLLDLATTRVHDNGLSEVFSQRVIQVLDDRGAREYGEFDIRYTPDTQSVQVKAARVYPRGGGVREGASQAERDVSEPWYGLYYDVRALVLRFEGLQPGDVIDVEYVVADVGRRNLLADYFGDVHYFQEEIPRVLSRYVLLWPEPADRPRPLYLNVSPGLFGVKVQRSEEKLPGAAGEPPLRLLRFEARDVPRLVAEAGMPGSSEIAPFLHVSTFKDWEDVSAFYRGLVAEQLAVPPEVKAAARAAVAGIPEKDRRQRLRAIYDFVVQKTRYVGLEFGIHGYKPYKIAQIFARKFGDCKDKAALLHVMLKEIGIDSSMVLARTRRMGGLPAEPASLSAFDHAIVFVPEFDLFLDGTAEFSGSDELPEQDQDIPVLIVADPRAPWMGKGHLDKTPVLAAARNQVARTLQVALRPDGGARLQERMEVHGQTAQKWREHYQSGGAQRERYEKSWNDTLPGVRAVKVDLPGIGDLEKPVTLRGELEAPAFGRAVPGTGGGERPRRAPDLSLRPLGRDPDLLRSFARLSQRRYDLVLGFPWRNTERVTIALPPGYVARRLPEAKTLESPLGRFAFGVEQRTVGGAAEITVTADLTVERHRVAAADYAAFRRFCAEVDSLVGQELVVGHE